MLSIAPPTDKTSRLRGSSAAFVCIAWLAFGSAVQAEDTAGWPDVIDRVSPSVVSILVDKKKPQKDAQSSGNAAKERAAPNDGKTSAATAKASQGAGMVLSSDGYVITTSSVLSDAIKITVVAGKSRLDAQVVGIDARTDIGLLKVIPAVPLTAVAFGDSDRLRRGQAVILIGNPFGLDGSVSRGIISAVGRDIGASPYDFIQTDAAMHKGSAGGPLFNIAGEVVGMGSSVMRAERDASSVGFAIPANLIKAVAGQLQRTGAISRGWLGVKIQNLDEAMAKSVGLDRIEGALVTDISKGSPAVGSGLMGGDTITAVDGRPIMNARDLARVIAEHEPNTEVTLSVVRVGGKKDVRIKLGTFPDASLVAQSDAGEGQDYDLADLGLKVKAAGQGGLTVEDVASGSTAAQKGIARGDVIVEAGGAQVNAIAELGKAIADSKAKGAVLLKLKSGNDFRFVAVPLGGKASEAPLPDDLRALDQLD